MSIIEKIKAFQKEQNGTKVAKTEEELMHILGDNYQDKEIASNPIFSYFIFEESDGLYYIMIQKGMRLEKNTNGTFSGVSFESSSLSYEKVDDGLISTLKRRKGKIERKRLTYQTERELKSINELFSHPSIRLRQVFVK